MVNEILQHFEQQHGTQLKLAGHRMKDKHNLLLFVEDRESFACLFDEQKWPATCFVQAYHRKLPEPPSPAVLHRPTQRPVRSSNHRSSHQRTKGIPTSGQRPSHQQPEQTTYDLRPTGHKPYRSDRRTTQEETHLHRRNEDSYLAIPGACQGTRLLEMFQIGHFRSQCKNTYDYCKACGLAVTDLKEHANACNKKLCCVRCKGDHESNDGRCPEIKSYRAALTKSLLAKPHTAIAPLA